LRSALALFEYAKHLNQIDTEDLPHDIAALAKLVT